MKTIFIITYAPAFNKSIIYYMEENFPDINKKYYVIDRHNRINNINLPNTEIITSCFDFFINKELKKDLDNCQKIIVCGVFSIQYILIFLSSKILRKVYLQFWGGDFYSFRETNFINKIKKIITGIVINKSKGIIVLIEQEKEEFKKIFNTSNKIYVGPVMDDKENTEIVQKKRKSLIEGNNKKSFRIVIGNSATKENDHLEIFQMLSKLAPNNLEIWCPLSYGDFQYRDKVISEGQAIFGDKFHALTNFMNYKEYVDFLGTCEVGIFAVNRQQGMGNISILLNLGKKVYIRKSTSMWEYYLELGCVVNDIENLKVCSYKELFYWKKEDAITNFHAMDARIEKTIENWREIFNEKNYS